MQLKQYVQYQMDFGGKWVKVCASFMGFSFFLRFVYYFGFTNLKDVGFIEILSSMLCSIALTGAFVFLLSWIHLNAPGLYGILGSIGCALLIFGSFSSGSALRIVLALIWYIPAAVILVATVGGFLPGRVLASFMFIFPAVVRLLFWDIGHLNLWQWAGELAALCLLAGLGCLPMSLREVRTKPVAQDVPTTEEPQQ